MMESDFRFYVTCKMAVITSFYAEVLPSGECTRSVQLAPVQHMQQRPPIARQHFCLHS